MVLYEGLGGSQVALLTEQGHTVLVGHSVGNYSSSVGQGLEKLANIHWVVVVMVDLSTGQS